MKRLLSFVLGLTLPLAAAAQTLPIPLLSGPQPVPAAVLMFNPLIQQINAVLVPVLGMSSSGAVNNIVLTGGVTGVGATIGLQPGADTNASITINPNGSGNIILFGSGDTGVLQFGNSTAFAKAIGLAGCPAATGPKSTPLNVKPVVTGYLFVKDWLGVSHGVPTC